MKDDVKFYVRILEKKPPGDLESIKISGNKKAIFVKTLKQSGLRPRDLYWQFNTDGVFLSSNQNEIFLKLVKIDLPSVLKGADLVIIAFGQTNSGKSYTMSAPYENHLDRGIIPRLLAGVLDKSQHAETFGTEINVKMSFLEFFHEKCYDLLTPGPTQINHRAMVPMSINSVEDGLGKFFKGETRRKYERVSNHCGASVLTLYIEAKSTMHHSANMNLSKIHIVDCPGIELMNSSKGKCQACKIAASLTKFNFDRAAKWSSILDEVLKYRNRLPCPPVFNCSNLVSFLGRSLTNGMVRLVGHILPDREHAKLTLSTLRFGCKMAKYLFSQVIYNARPELANLAEVLEDEVTRLENEAHQNSLIRVGGEYNSNNVFQDEIQHIERLIAQYLSDKNLGQMTENILLSTAHPTIVFREIKNHYRKDLEKQIQQQDGSVSASEEAARWTALKTARDSFMMNRKASSSVISREAEPAPAPAPAPPKEEVSAVEKSAPSSGAASTGGGKRKSVSKKNVKRKSIARKSKIGPSSRRGGGKKILPVKPEKPKTPPEFNREMLDFGLKNTKWFFDEFLKRNAELNQQFNAVNEELTNARNEKDKASWSLVQERKNLAEATYGAEEASCKQSAGGGEADLAKEQEFLAQIEAIKTRINEIIGEMTKTHENYVKAIAAQAKFLEQTAEPKFKEFVQALEISLAEVPIYRADAKDLPIFKADTFRSLRIENITDNRTDSEIKFDGLQRKHGGKKIEKGMTSAEPRKMVE